VLALRATEAPQWCLLSHACRVGCFLVLDNALAP
jgi:hypothetical protein